MKRKRETLADHVVNEFLEELEKGIFKYGEKLPSHDKLADYFDVSRIVVREALNKLSVLGIVRFHQGKGTYIKPQEEMVVFSPEIMQFTFNSSKNILSILESRKIIEKEICILAAERRDDNDCTKLKELLDLMDENQDDIRLYSKYDLEFHLAIAKASKNPVFVQLLYMIKDLYKDQMMDTVFSIPGIVKESSEAHEIIYQAILTNDGNEASRIMEEHIEIVENILYEEKNAEVKHEG